MMGGRIRQVFGETPFLFFGVVIGLAVIFRVGVGVARESARPEVVAPVFVSTSPEPGLSAMPSATPSASTPSASTTGEVGAVGRVQPIGTPVQVPPRTRGHGRRPLKP